VANYADRQQNMHNEDATGLGKTVAVTVKN